MNEVEQEQERRRNLLLVADAVVDIADISSIGRIHQKWVYVRAPSEWYFEIVFRSGGKLRFQDGNKLTVINWHQRLKHAYTANFTPKESNAIVPIEALPSSDQKEVKPQSPQDQAQEVVQGYQDPKVEAPQPETGSPYTLLGSKKRKLESQ